MRIILLLAVLPLFATAQHTSTTDIDNFWTAYDSLQASSDTMQQAAFINRLYIDKASPGLRVFMRNKDGLDKKWVSLIKTNAAFWDALRPKMQVVKRIVPKIEERITYYQTLYPQLKPSTIYFLIGVRQQGGTIRNNLSLIGTEVVLSDSAATPASLLQMCIHEYTHTQQKRPDFQKINVLTSSIREGACDFMAELVTQQPLTAVYMQYGNTYEAALWKLFKQDMLTTNNDNWVSTGDNPNLPVRDPGYFVGYKICKAYYDNAIDKQQAIKEIIELDYADEVAVEGFLLRSNYGKGL